MNQKPQLEIVKPHHNKAKRVSNKDLNSLHKYISDLIDIFDKRNRSFRGDWHSAVALHHCYVSKYPLDFFIVNKTLMTGEDKISQNESNWIFKSRVIFNPEIIKADVFINEMIKTKEIEKQEDGKNILVDRIKEHRLQNIIDVKDACMMYPHRKIKNYRRYFKITVRYQIMRKFLCFRWLKTIEEEITGLKSHIFQHEIDHSHGIDINFGDGVNKDPKRYYEGLSSK